jgi:agmatinase
MPSPYETLESILAPAGGGVHVVSTGLEETRALQRRIYRAESDDEIRTRWSQALRRIPDARVVVLGVPSDTGAGFVRGANLGPSALRHALLEASDHPVRESDVVDAGDVRVIPHLLSDEMISDEQRSRSRNALYCDPRSELPVTPLDQCALALHAIRELNPHAVPVVIGGDHSIGWPAFSTALHWAEGQGRRVGLLHFDAHTDLLEERLGVRYCFATWAYHANELLHRDGRLVQVGIRASARTREHWETTLGVRQYWPEEYRAKSSTAIAAEIAERFRALKVDSLYVSNDIDGTDAAFAGATGTPEGDGLHPDQVSEITLALTREFPLIGADLVEVAPPLGAGRPGEPQRTLQTALRYLADLVGQARIVRQKTI